MVVGGQVACAVPASGRQDAPPPSEAGEIGCERLAMAAATLVYTGRKPALAAGNGTIRLRPKDAAGIPMMGSATWCAPHSRPDQDRATAPACPACCPGCRALALQRAVSGKPQPRQSTISARPGVTKAGTTACARTAGMGASMGCQPGRWGQNPEMSAQIGGSVRLIQASGPIMRRGIRQAARVWPGR